METILPPLAETGASLPVSTSDLHEKVADMQASMQYAGRLQRALLPNEKRYADAFEDAFVYYHPKDIISGDFYWIFEHDDQVYYALGDCTGHGIPGAMVSMAGMTMLRQVIRIHGLNDPAAILTALDVEITALFNEHVTDGVTRDGMDISFVRFDRTKRMLFFCGANRPLLRVRDGVMEEWDGDRFPIGYYDLGHKAFQTYRIPVRTGDQFYMFSDGYTDQFGGSTVKKFNRKRFRTLLTSLQDMSMGRQRDEIVFAFDHWKGKQEQIDDVTVIGVKIP